MTDKELMEEMVMITKKEYFAGIQAFIQIGQVEDILREVDDYEAARMLRLVLGIKKGVDTDDK